MAGPEMLRFLIRLIIALACLLPVQRPEAQDRQHIVAVVNDDVISANDLAARVSLLLATSNLQDVPENRSRVGPFALRALIDERLKLQEAKRLNVQVSRDDVDQGIARFEAQLGIPPRQLPRVLAYYGVGMQAVRDHIRAEVAWVKAVTKRAQGQVVVSDEDVTARLEQLKQDAGKPEVRVAEIFLPTDNPAKEAEVKALADRLMAELKAGASFPGLARNFSQSPSAAMGGDLGWLRVDDFEPALQSTVADMTAGEAYGPVRTQAGYQIVLMIDRRTAKGITGGGSRVVLSQLVLPVPAGASAAQTKARMDEAKQLAASAKSCEDLRAIGRANGSPLSGELGATDIGQLAPDMQNLVRPLRAGEKTAPFQSKDGIVVLMVCSRTDGDTGGEARDRVRDMLANERLATLSRRMLRDLTREAFVDIRR